MIVVLLILTIIFFILFYKPIEAFTQCLLPQRYRIFSTETNISIPAHRHDKEISISELRSVLKGTTKNNYMTVLKNTYRDFRKIYSIDDEVIIYRNGKAYGFHLICTDAKVDVVGIIMSYDIESIYKEKEPSTITVEAINESNIEYIKNLRYLSTKARDTILSYLHTHSGMSSSSEMT